MRGNGNNDIEYNDLESIPNHSDGRAGAESCQVGDEARNKNNKRKPLRKTQVLT